MFEKIRNLFNNIRSKIGKKISEIRSNTNDDLCESLSLDKEEIKRQLEAAINVEERVKLFSKWMDKYWIDAIIWMIPIIWDLGPAIVSSCYLLAEWKHIWLSQQDLREIFTYQVIDFWIWFIPFIWAVWDFFYKWNKKSAEVFTEHIEKLKKAALNKGVPQEEIDRMEKRELRFLSALGYYLKKYFKKQETKKSA